LATLPPRSRKRKTPLAVLIDYEMQDWQPGVMPVRNVFEVEQEETGGPKTSDRLFGGWKNS
jgi:hypothetical protein